MKKALSTFFIMAAFAITFGLSSLAMAAQNVTLQTTGMTCEVCSGAIKGAFQEIEGVESVEADHETGLVTLSIADDSTLTDDALIAVVKNAGFDVESVTR